MDEFSDLYTPETHVAVYSPHGSLTAAGRIKKWDSENHRLHIEATPRYIATHKGLVRNHQMRKSTTVLDPAGQIIKELDATMVQEEYPINQAIELRGSVISTTTSQGRDFGVLATIDNNYFGLNPYIGVSLDNKPDIIDAYKLIPIQGTILEQNPHRLEDIINAVTPAEKPLILD